MSLLQNFMMAGISRGIPSYSITNSCRFNDNDTAYLSRTTSSEPTGGDSNGSQKFTISLWVKRGNLGFQTVGGGAKTIIGANSTTASTFQWQFAGTSGSTSPDELDWDQEDSGSPRDRYIPNALFRDPSAWMHLVLAVDTTQSTASDRLKLYINGTLETSVRDDDPPAENAYLQWNANGELQRVGGEAHSTSNTFDGYISEFHNIDGVAAYSLFGETNENGIWVPKQYNGSYGNNGFHLDFQSSGDLGNDVSGNNNDFTSSGLTSTDQRTDTPTNNHCTWNPLNKSTYIDLRKATLQASGQGGPDVYPVCGTQAMDSGKWYIEFKIDSLTAAFFGVGSTVESNRIAGGTFTNITTGEKAGFTSGVSYQNNGNKHTGGSTTTYGDTFTTNDIIGIAIDVDTGSVWFSKNGTFQNSGDPEAGTNTAASGLSIPLTIFCSFYSATYVTMRSEEADWSYSAPSGFNAINTSNIAEPSIADSSKYFQVELYTGNGTAIGSGGKAITFSGNSSMQPDLVWIKNRDAADSYGLYDAVRGTTKQLECDDASVETTETEGLTTLGSDGFTVGSLDQLNTNTEDYVSWNWKESSTSGFDIVSYTGDGSNRTISHSLGAVPSMMIIKSRSDAGYNWAVYHEQLGNTKIMTLNTTDTPTTASTFWQDTTPTSSVFSVGTHGNVNADTVTYIAYLFASIEGFSLFSKYVGNGSTDGPFIWCGFKPAMVFWKNSSDTGFWEIRDYKRTTGGNPITKVLVPNSSEAEGTTDNVDFLSNGFKLRSTGHSRNDNGDIYIYAAFAENPFGGAETVPSTAR